MKISQYISSQRLALSFGIVMSLLVLSQAVFVPAPLQDRQEQSNDDTQEKKQEVSPSIAVASSGPQVNLGYQSYLVEEIFASEKTSLGSYVSSWFIAPAKKALKILFRQIISPNAP